MKNLTVVLSVILIVMFLLCWNHNLPYLYFQFLRVIAILIFAVCAFYDYENGNKYFAFIFIISIFIINPIFKIPLGRFYWNVLDTIWSLILIVRIINLNFFIKK